MPPARRKGQKEEFRFVKYEKHPREQRYKFDGQVDKLFNAEHLNGVLVCGANMYLYNQEKHRLEKSVKEGLGRTTVIQCIHIPQLRAIYTSTIDCKIAMWDDNWFAKKRQWLVDDPQLCFLTPRPLDYRRGEPVPVPTRLISGDSVGRIHDWDLNKGYTGLAEAKNVRKVHDDWVTDVMVPENSQHLLITCSLDASVKLWDRKSVFKKDERGGWLSGPLRRITTHDRPVTGLLDLPHLDLVVSWGQNHHICVWSPTTDEVMQRLEGHGRPVVRVMQGAHVHELISVDREGVACVWDCRMFTLMQRCVDKVRGSAGTCLA
jgi:WD40 repeat protein